MKKTKEYKDAMDKAYKESGHNAYFGNGFSAGYDFAMAQPKHIFDGVANVGEKRRFEGRLVDVVDDTNKCEDCILVKYDIDCQFFTGCDTNDVKYIASA